MRADQDIDSLERTDRREAAEAICATAEYRINNLQVALPLVSFSPHFIARAWYLCDKYVGPPEIQHKIEPVAVFCHGIMIDTKILGETCGDCGHYALPVHPKPPILWVAPASRCREIR
jgi:hypothetical protein